VLAGSDQLAELRAERRQAVRAAALAKSEGGAPFGLLVIPVDFADRRGLDQAKLARRLEGTTGSLTHYYDVASQGRTALTIVRAPLVSLTGARLDYSDAGLQGNERSRAMAAEALAGAAAAGVRFADADRDGDGEVDGVLILHAAPGRENDPDGLILPLQYFLADPVLESGTLARSYAVASALSGVGLWAHETGHLFGLEDRYDVLLPGTEEALPRGGLGRFSLMGSGWLGTGEAHDPALPDAYSRLALGWADLATDLATGTVVRLRSELEAATAYFLVEQRDGSATPPYDPGITPERAVVYLVDESLADGEVGGPSGERWLRVQLVEADGGDELRDGQDDGRLADLFPTVGTTQDLDADSDPSSRLHGITSTGVAATFTVVDGRVAVIDRSERPWADVRVVFPPAGQSGPVTVVARVEPATATPPEIGVHIAVLSDAWGSFETETGLSPAIGARLVPADHDGWATHVADPPVTWRRTDDPPPGATALISVSVESGASGEYLMTYPWHDEHAPLAPSDDWRDHWHRLGDIERGAWYRWTAGPEWIAELGPIFACTAAEDSTGVRWPAVTYPNRADARLVSAPLGRDVAWVAFTHAVDVELLHPGVAVDAASVFWVAASGARVPAEPQDGWLGRCDSRSPHRLAGVDGFARADSLREGAVPLWRREMLAVPSPQQHGPGPWRLSFELASNPIWRGRGWLVRDLVAGTGTAPATGFACSADGDSLRWAAPDGITATGYTIEWRGSDEAAWRVAATVDAATRSWPLAALGVRGGWPFEIRVVAMAGQPVASRELSIQGRAAEPRLWSPRPNPATSHVRIDYDAADDPRAQLAIYDLRGRLVRRWRLEHGAGQIVWEGLDERGRRVASGVYIVRLAANGRTRTGKVTWTR
jgi:M6 family metalloprotease-like protein